MASAFEKRSKGSFYAELPRGASGKGFSFGGEREEVSVYCTGISASDGGRGGGKRICLSAS